MGNNTKVYCETHGCSTNQAEEEVMAGLLDKEGYSVVDTKEKADLIVLNMCSVKGLSVTKKAIKDINSHIDSNPGKKMILSGCIPRDEHGELRSVAPNASFIHTDNMMQISEVANSTMNGDVLNVMDVNKSVKIGFPIVRRNPYVSIIPINEGCNDNCTYCSTKRIKGSTKSYPMRTIVKEIEKAVTEGCREVWITSQDTCAYGMDLQEKSMLPELLTMIIKLEGDFRVRVGMLNPSNLLPVVDEFLSVMSDPKMYKFLHIPIQSGDDEVLDAMKRRYSVNDVQSIVDKFKAKFPKGTLSTDIIVGFPGENEDQFDRTVQLCDDNKIETVNISRYQDRTGTMSWRMNDTVKIIGNVKRDRSRILSDVFRSYSLENNKKMIGWEGSVLITDRKQDLLGRTDSYKLVVIKRPESMSLSDYEALMGKRVNVKIVDADVFYGVGELL